MPKPSTKGDGTNRSAAIRAALIELPKAGPKEIVAHLAGKGIKVAPTLVYYIRSEAKKKQRKQKRAIVASTSEGTKAGNPVDLVVRVKALARDAGGIGDLKRLVDALAE